MRKLIFMGMVTLIGMSCSTNPKDNLARPAETPVPLNVEQQVKFIAPSDSGIVKPVLVDEKGSVRTRKDPNQTVYIEFQSKGNETLTAHLSSPDSLANIRFSQIFLPDGTMDGPFGRDIEYNLPIEGVYKISVHENMMAGDPWGGEFSVDMQLTGR